MSFHILCLDDTSIPNNLCIDGSIDIGRDPHCDIRLADESCSRFHAHIKIHNNTILLSDNESSNGTWFQQQKIKQQELHHNDQFRCGETHFILLDSEAEDNQTRIVSDAGNAIAVSHSVKSRSWKTGDNPQQLTIIHHLCQQLANCTPSQRPQILAHNIQKIINSSQTAIYMHGAIRAGELSHQLAQRLATSNGAKLYVLGKDLHGQTIAQEAVGSALSVHVDDNIRIIAVRHINLDPFTADDLQFLSHIAHDVQSYFKQHGNEIPLIGNSQEMQQLRTRIQRIAHSDTTVLISGESGTGKEIVAQSIHKLSSRHLGPMICVNCAAISGSLFEAELFGHEIGAFTGATQKREGKIRAAHGGTLFLDEVGELSLDAQAKLLRVLQDQRVQAVGSELDITVDVRIIAATNRDLHQMVEEKSFRQDLLYRLDILRIHTIALNAHRQDIPEICSFLLQRIAQEEGRPNPEISASVLKKLTQQTWPGNVRQLENT
ncbi:MAG: sigma 54-interacting transcriptional regulator, partial [Planctomycetes bacterium]|nr:sigma 54-interacting transcriptional regulator [Planctomycetota bacterium]